MNTTLVRCLKYKIRFDRNKVSMTAVCETSCGIPNLFACNVHSDISLTIIACVQFHFISIQQCLFNS